MWGANTGAVMQRGCIRGVRPVARALRQRGGCCDVTVRQAQGSLPVHVWSEETPESLVAMPSCVAEMPGAEQGGCDWPVRSVKRSLQRRYTHHPVGWTRGSRADSMTAKAMEDIWDSGAGVEGPSGVRDVERSDGCPGNWGGPPRPRRCGRREARRPITAAREVVGGREGVGGGRSSDDGRDNITRPERRTPASSMHRR